MTFTSDCPQGRSQDLTFAEADDKIVIDRETFRRLHLLLGSCVDTLVNPRDCEIFLTSLDTYLSEDDNPEASKCLLLLNHYRDVVPDALLEISGLLEQGREIIRLILAASKLGDNNG